MLVDGEPKLKPRLALLVDVLLEDWPNRPAKGLDCSFAGGVAAVTSTDGADESLVLAPNLIGVPCLYVLSVVCFEPVAPKENPAKGLFVSALEGVLGREPKSPSPGIGPSLRGPPSMEELKMELEEVTVVGVKLNLVVGTKSPFGREFVVLGVNGENPGGSGVPLPILPNIKPGLKELLVAGCKIGSSGFLEAGPPLTRLKRLSL